MKDIPRVRAQALADLLMRAAEGGYKVSVTYQPEPRYWEEMVWWLKRWTQSDKVHIQTFKLVDGVRIDIHPCTRD